MGLRWMRSANSGGSVGVAWLRDRLLDIASKHTGAPRTWRLLNRLALTIANHRDMTGSRRGRYALRSAPMPGNGSRER